MFHEFVNANRFRNGLALGRLLPVYVLLGFVKHVVPLRRLVQLAWCPPAGPRDFDAERRLAAAVVRLSQLARMPDRDCLQRSLLLYRVLSRAAADPTLIVGFQRVNGRIRGHAWVVVNGCTLVECKADLVGFSPILEFGTHGALLRARSEARNSD